MISFCLTVCLFLESSLSADGPGLAWSRCPGGTSAVDLEYVVRANLHPVTQEAADATGLGVIEFRAGLAR